MDTGTPPESPDHLGQRTGLVVHEQDAGDDRVQAEQHVVRTREQVAA